MYHIAASFQMYICSIFYHACTYNAYYAISAFDVAEVKKYRQHDAEKPKIERENYT